MPAAMSSASADPLKRSLSRRPSALRASFRKTRLCLAVSALFAPGLSFSAPVIGNGGVTSGAATIVQAGKVTNVNQTTNKAAINWQSFSTAPTETVNFNQPGASSITLNRVIGNERSVLEGALNATGKVFLINSNGVLFGKGSSVNTGGLVASTLNLTDADFNAGNYVFKAGGAPGSVINLGSITARDRGYVALLGNAVSNQGVITATTGTVALNSGDKITLNFNGDSLLNVTLDAGTLNGLVENKQAIYADGGKVIMTAKAADELLSAQVNNSGVVQARNINDLKGTIELNAHGGTANVAGTLDASAPAGGNGGFIETSGDRVKIDDSAVITTQSVNSKSGTWLIDPTDFNIVNGGGAQTTSGIGVETLKTNLGSGNVSIATVAGGTENGDININAPLAWTSGNNLTLTAGNNVNVNSAVTWGGGALTLNASNDVNVNSPVTWGSGAVALNAGKNIFVNAVMSATGTANFAGNYGHVLDGSGNPTSTITGNGFNADSTPYGLYTFYGTDTTTTALFAGKINFSGSGGVSLNSESYTVINSLADLQAARSNPNGRFVMGSDIAPPRPATAWTFALDNGTAFDGKFNGFGHVTGTVGDGFGGQVGFTTTAVSLFGTIGSNAVISNVGINEASISASAGSLKTAQGILADVNHGSIVNSFAAGTLNASTASLSTGGLVGTNSGLIAQSHSLANVNSVQRVGGGLVGTNTASGRIVDSAAQANPGGLNGNVATITYTGGLAGVNEGIIERSYAIGGRSNLTGVAAGGTSNAMSGGFVGLNAGTIDQAYAAPVNAGVFLGGRFVAGFVGENTGTITNAYTTSLNVNNTAPGASWDAGFAYKNSGTIENAYALGNATATKQRYGFVFDNTGGTLINTYWAAREAATAPAVKDSPDGSPPTGATKLSIADSAVFSSYAGFDPAAWGASQSGHPVLKNLLVHVRTNPASVPVYGSATSAGTLSLQARGLQGGGGVPAQVDNVGSLNPFVAATANGFVDAGARAAADVLSSSAYSNLKGTVTVNPKALTVTGAVADKVYDGTTSGTPASGVTNGGLGGLIGSQTLTIDYTSATFADKNVGTNKNVSLAYTVGNGANGGKASNYTIATTTTASITPKPITSTFGVDDKVYDGTTAATVTDGSYLFPGLIAGDSLSLTYSSALFDNANVGTNKTVTLSGLTLTGSSAGNYTLQNPQIQSTGKVTPLPVELGGIKTPDGSDTANGAVLFAKNAVPGDVVGFSGSVKLASGAPGTQPIMDLTQLTVNNPNYTLVGSVGGSVFLGSQNLVQDGVAPAGVDIATAGSTTTVTQTTAKAIIDWLRFSVGAGETINFVQPSVSSVTLNRVTGNDATVIAGALNANGRVFILNSAGVLFQAGSSVNVAALVASTLKMSDTDFNNGNYVFIGAPGTGGSVVGAGDIVIVDGGFAAFASGSGVTHTGSLTAAGGKAVLASANSLTLNLNASDNSLDGYSAANLAGTTTVGGTVDVSSAGGDGLIETAGSNITFTGNPLNTGTSGSLSYTRNTITIGGAGSTVESAFVDGQLASRHLALNALSGNIAVNDAINWSADKTLALNAPTNINFNNALTASGAGAGLTLNAGTDVNFNAPVSLSGNNASLAMTYGGDYNILTKASFSGAVLDSSGKPVARQDTSGGIYGSIALSGAGSTLNINSQGYTLLRNMSDIAAANGVAGRYALAQDSDATGNNYTAAVIGNFNGTLAGLGHTIGNLTIAAGATDNVGLIGQIGAANATIRDIGLTNVDITGRSNIGALLGNYTGTGLTVSQAYSTGTITGAGPLGGLIGKLGNEPADTANVVSATPSTVRRSYSTASINGSQAGGLIGLASGATITNSHATGAVSGSQAREIGGLIGRMLLSSVDNSYATGNVTGSFRTPEIDDLGRLVNGGVSSVIGGLIGFIRQFQQPGAASSVTNSFATGAVSGEHTLGGLIGSAAGISISGYVNDGYAPFWTTVTNSYATGNVTANNAPTILGVDFNLLSGSNSIANAGGLIGLAANVNVANAHASGDVVSNALTGQASNIGGLIGQTARRTSGTPPASSGSITGSFATGNVRGAILHDDNGVQYYNGQDVGGLVGGASGATIANSFATGDVAGNSTVGGLVGRGGLITDSHATGNVTGSVQLGGLVGTGTSVTRSLAEGDVTGISYTQGGTFVASRQIGGLMGDLVGTVTDSWASGKVSGSADVAGLIGRTGFDAVVRNSYWNIDSTGQTTGIALPSAQTVVIDSQGLTGAQFQDISSYVDGSIGQVLADRAAAAAQAAAEAAAVAAAAEVVQRVRREDAGQRADGLVQSAQRETGTLVPTLSFGSNAPSVESRIVFTDSPGFSANVNSISVDGVKFDVENPGTAKPNTESGEGPGK